MGNGHHCRGIEMAERRDVIGQRSAEGQAGRAGGETEAVKGPENGDADHNDGRKCAAETQSEPRARAFGRGCNLPGDEQQQHGSQQDSGVLCG